MRIPNLLALSAVCALVSTPLCAQEATVTYKSLSPELALDAAKAALADCRTRGYQVSVAVVDRFGVGKRAVLLKLREAGDVVEQADSFGDIHFPIRPVFADGDGAGIGGNTDRVFELELMHRMKRTVYPEPVNIGSEAAR